jgi:transcription initiation factor IIF auxiliary subunit
MTIILRKLLIQLGVLAVLGAIPLTSYADLIVKNISSYIGAGRWDWTIFVEADSRSLQQIKCVEYHLHPTFSEPVRKVCNQPETKFAYSTNGWGTFTVKVNILFKDGHSQELEHPLVFEQKPKLVPLNVSPNNWWQEIEPGWWKWGVYIDGTPTELDRIRCVEYTLHRTFPNPVRVVCSPQNRFQLVALGWGTFTVKIKLLLKDGSMRQMSHQLKFR